MAATYARANAASYRTKLASLDNYMSMCASTIEKFNE